MSEHDVTGKCDGGRQTLATGDEQNIQALDGSDGSMDGSRDGKIDGKMDGSTTDESVNTRSSVKRSGRGRGEVACYSVPILYQPVDSLQLVTLFLP